jgi:four helix bundle protein
MAIVSNLDDARQLVRASGSIGANYIEANEALGQKDFLMHVRISRKVSKESRYFLRLLDTDNHPNLEAERAALVQEAAELMNISAPSSASANDFPMVRFADSTPLVSCFSSFPDFEFVSDFVFRNSVFQLVADSATITDWTS